MIGIGELGKQPALGDIVIEDDRITRVARAGSSRKQAAQVEDRRGERSVRFIVDADLCRIDDLNKVGFADIADRVGRGAAATSGGIVRALEAQIGCGRAPILPPRV